MVNGHKVVVTFTSWKKRIRNCVSVINCIMENTTRPDSIYLNLSEAEFPGKLKDLPKDLVKMETDIPIFHINWVSGPNTKSMKKIFPILKFLDDEDIIITCDDDFVLPKDFIEVRIREFVQYGCRYAISSSNKREWHFRTIYGKKYWALGSGSLFTKRMFRNYDTILNKNLINTYHDDVIYALMVLSNGFWIEPTKILSNQSGSGPRKISYV